MRTRREGDAATERNGMQAQRGTEGNEERATDARLLTGHKNWRRTQRGRTAADESTDGQTYGQTDRRTEKEVEEAEEEAINVAQPVAE